MVGLEQESDDLGSPRAQALGGAVGNIAQLLGHLGDDAAGLLGDQRIVSQRAGHGGHGEAACLRDGAQCRFFRDRPVFYVFTLIHCESLCSVTVGCSSEDM